VAQAVGELAAAARVVVAALVLGAPLLEGSINRGQHQEPHHQAQARQVSVDSARELDQQEQESEECRQ
jgi:hypothetical protein